MKTGNVAGRQMMKLGQAAIGFLCSMVCVMGYYPLVPAFYTAGCLWKKRSILFYAGMLAGIFYFMNFSAMFKYILLLVVITAAIRLYGFANRKCSGMAGAVLAGAATIVMNGSGSLMASNRREELVLGISEGVLVAGLAFLIYSITELASELVGNSLKEIERREAAPPMEQRPDEKIEALVSAVDGLSEVFTAMGRPKEINRIEDVGLLQQEIEGNLCAACDGCAICWTQNRISRTGSIREMIAAVMEHRTCEEILREQYVQECSRYPDMVEKAIQAFGRMELNRAWYQRLIENRQIIAGQLDAMVELMAEWKQEEICIDDRSRFLMARIGLETKERGLLVQNLHVYTDGEKRRYIRAHVASKWGGGIPARYYLKALEKAMRRPMRLEREARSVITKDWTRITAYEDTGYYALPGIAMRKKDASSISGDNFTMFDLDDGHHVIGLSDGMGSGSRANQESEMVVDLLERLIRAGFRKEIAIKMMNSAMVLQGEENSFSTLDLAYLDLYSGQLDLLKIGAAASFYKHGEEVSCLLEQTLPAGADPGIEIRPITRKVENGDFLVMVTDGVLECLKNPVDTLSHMIADITTDNAGAFAKNLLDQVLVCTEGVAQDDMTVLVTGIWEK